MITAGTNARRRSTEQPQRRGLIASGLGQDLENLAFAVDGAPHIHLPSSDWDHHFVEMPSIVGLGSDLAQVLGNYWPEFENPPTDRFIADHQAALGQEILGLWHVKLFYLSIASIGHHSSY
jgi:hypothetical protein